MLCSFVAAAGECNPVARNPGGRVCGIVKAAPEPCHSLLAQGLMGSRGGRCESRMPACVQLAWRRAIGAVPLVGEGDGATSQCPEALRCDGWLQTMTARWLAAPLLATKPCCAAAAMTGCMDAAGAGCWGNPALPIAALIAVWLHNITGNQRSGRARWSIRRARGGGGASLRLSASASMHKRLSRHLR